MLQTIKKQTGHKKLQKASVMHSRCIAVCVANVMICVPEITRRVQGPKMPDQKILQKNNRQARCLCYSCYSINAWVPREYTRTYTPLLPVFMPLVLVLDKLKPHCLMGHTQCCRSQASCTYNHANTNVYATGVHIKLKPHRLVEHFIFTAWHSIRL